MYGGIVREGELWSPRRHMWPVPSSSVAAAVSESISPDCFDKDGRKIHVGDCALFETTQDSPPFVGIIRRLIISKEKSLSLSVNWLYRPADLKLKGALVEAAPNEVFYSFHKDEIPAASLLHPCKVAFLRKGVELPPGLSSFVCRRVYDIDHKRLWWLTDRDYIKSCSTQERQEEVNQLLDKTRLEMYGTLPTGGRSPKPLNGSNGTSQSKPGTDSVPNTTSSFSSQVKGRKRELGAHGSDSVKRERLSRPEDTDSSQHRPENTLKSEIAKITDKGALVDFEGVEKLVQLMRPNSAEKKIDLASRIMLVDVISVTDRFDCLHRFVDLRGLPVLDEWLQEVHKGKIGDSSSPKESDKTVEEFLLALLRALDRLPVNLHALQTCNVGKSVNHLRTHKNSEIQKKARGLVDTWKKRVEAEMNIIDSKSGTIRGGSWPTKPVISEVPQAGARRTAGSAEVCVKSPTSQSSESKIQPAKLSSGSSVGKFSLGSSGSVKLPATAPAISKDPNCAILDGATSSDLPLATVKEDRSSSSSQSQNNSHSCSSDHGKTEASCREDARSSTAVSMSASKISSGVSRGRKASNGLHGSSNSGIQKDFSSGKLGSVNRGSASEKGSPTGVTAEKVGDMSNDNGSSQRIIVRLPNAARSPAQNSGGGSHEGASATFTKGSPAQNEKHEHRDRNLRGKIDAVRGNGPLDTNMDFYPGRDGLVVSDEVNIPAVGAFGDERNRDVEAGEILKEASKGADCPPGYTQKVGKSYEASYSSINALVESCAKFSAASVSASSGDEIGMNLLASVAAGEMSKSGSTPGGSPERKSHLPEESVSCGEVKLRQSDKAGCSDENSNGRNGNNAMVDRGSSVDSLCAEGGFENRDMPESKITLLGSDEKTDDCRIEVDAPIVDFAQNGSIGGKSSGPKQDSIAAISSAEVTNGCKGPDEEAVQSPVQKNLVSSRTRSHNVLSSNVKTRGQLSAEEKSMGHDEKFVENARVADATATSAKLEVHVNDESASLSSSEMHLERKMTVHTQLCNSSLVGQKPSYNSAGEITPLAPGTDTDVLPKAENADHKHAGSLPQRSEKQGLDSGHNSNLAQDNPEKKEVLGHGTAGPAPLDKPATPSPAQAEEASSGVNPSSISASGAGGSVKLDFDLNEDILPVDDGSQGEFDNSSVPGNYSSVQLPCPRPVSVSSIPGSLPGSITVAAAAKGPFLPSESLLRSKVELGWKGSAATSAFRPAEPRKAAPDVLPDLTAGKQARPHLDFDLNVGVAEDTFQNNAPLTSSEGEPSDRRGGRLDLDLNTCEESTEVVNLSVTSNGRSRIPHGPPKSLLSGGFSGQEMNSSRDFDLNNGPGPDDVGSDSLPLARSGMPFLSSFPGVRMNNMEMGNFSSWFPPGNAYPAIAVPSIFPGRGDQSYPIVPASASQRIFTPATASTSFGPEFLRGPVLSSSPAVAFSSTTPFQYPGFPFDTNNFPLSSNSYSGVSTPYVDSSSGGPLCFPSIPSQMVGPSGVVSTPYRPYVMNIPGSSSNAVSDGRKWGSQGLDLNSGPVGGLDVDRREERLPMRQPPLGSQAFQDEQLKMFQQMAGNGVLKRKEPDGGWDSDRISSKHPSWQQQ